MKFKTIFILFNAVMLFSFLFMLIMPFFILKSDFSLTFWANNWILALFFVFVIVFFNLFFIGNWKSFELVENEDWKGLMEWLELRFFSRNRFSRRNLKLFINSALLEADAAAISRLEERLEEKAKWLLKREALLFVVARSLGKDLEGNARFIERFSTARGVENSHWLNFYRAMNLFMQKNDREALEIFRSLARSRDAALALLAAYMSEMVIKKLPGSEKDRQTDDLIQGVKTRLKKKYSPSSWSLMAEKIRSELHLAVMGNILDDASSWLFSGS